MKNIAVFCSSSNALENIYYNFAEVFGRQLAAEGFNLVYGGANVGMMKILADTVKENGGKVIGVIPKSFDHRGLTQKNLDKLFIVPDMQTRKKKIISISDAFVALPGGFGTLDELLEVIVLKQLSMIHSPIVILNFNGFYDNMLKMFDDIFEQNFAKSRYKNLYYVADCIDDVFEYIKKYEPVLDLNWHKVDKTDFEK